MAHPIRPESYVAMDNFYYDCLQQGAEVIHMYATLLRWPHGFHPRAWTCTLRDMTAAVTCDDFRSAMADANGVDLTQFERWCTRAGTPTVELSDKKLLMERFH